MGAEPDQQTRIFVISGTQGAGKTSVAAMLARRFERGVHVPADALHKMIVAGREWPRTPAEVGEAPVEWESQLRLRLHNMCLLGRSFREAGFDAVLDDIIIGDRIDALRHELSDVPYTLVMLVPSKEAVRSRERGRGTALFEDWEWLTDEFLEAPRDEGMWIDSSEMTAEETVDEILRQANVQSPSGARIEALR